MTTKVSKSVLADTTVSAGTYGGSTIVPVITFDAQGRATYSANVAITPTYIQANTNSGLFANGTQGSSQTGTVLLSLANTAVTPGTYGGVTSSTDAIIPSFTVDGSGRLTYTGNNTSITANTLSPQFISLGVGTAASGVLGAIRAIDEVTAYYTSDERLKENIVSIDNALNKIKQLKGVMFDWKDDIIAERGGEDGYFVRKHDTGIIAQDVEKVLPEVVVEKQNGYKAVRYEKLAGLIIQAINELANEVEKLKKD